MGNAVVVQLAEQLLCKQTVGGSIPSCGNLCIAQPGRAPALGAGGRMFEPCYADQLLGHGVEVAH